MATEQLIVCLAKKAVEAAAPAHDCSTTRNRQRRKAYANAAAVSRL
jgi:hypothetical protein